MRKASAGLLALVVGFGLAAQAKDVELVANGKAKAEIVVAKVPASVVRFAALELQAHVRTMTGVELPIVADDARTGAYPIFIGSGMSATRDFDFGRLPEQGYVVDIGAERTVLLGRDSSRSNDVSVVYGENPGVIVSAKGLPHVLDSVFEARGSLDAVYGFLHANCGVDWLDCTEAGVSCPKRGTLAVRTGRTVDSPFVRCRDTAVDPEEWDERRDAAGLLRYRKTAWPRAFAEAKDERAAQARVKLAKDVFALRLRVGGERMHANHSFYWCYDRFWDRKNARFVEYRPEWFSKHLKKAKKGMAADGEIFSAFDTSVKPAQMCYSNEGFIRQTVVDVRAYFDAGGYTNTYTNQGRPCSARHPIASWGRDVYCLEPMDNNSFCECPRCLSQYRPERRDDRAECSDYWFGFVNKVAREIRKSHPGKRISTLAYGPRREGLPSFPLEDNVVVHFCWDSNRGPNREPLMTKQTDLMRKWRAAYPERPLGLWLYGGFPHDSGTWSHYTPPPGFFGALFDREMKFIRDLNIRECIFNCGLKDDFELFLGGRLMWNPSEGYESLKKEYFRGFGPAEKAMRRFYEIIEERICTRDHYEGYSGHMNRDVAYGKLLTDEVFDRLEQAMAEAEAAVGSGGTSWQKARVRNWRVGYWDYLLGARYRRFEQPDPAPGVHLACTECYSAKPRPLGGPDALAELPFAAKGSGGGFLWGLDPKTGDRPDAYRAMTTEGGFHGFWNGPNPTQLVYRCDARIGKLTRLRIVTSDFARSRMFFNLVGWRQGKKVMLLEGVDFPRAFFAKGCAVWDLDFEDRVAPRDLDAIGIEERFWEKKYTASPRYMRIQAVDGGDETQKVGKSIDAAAWIGEASEAAAPRFLRFACPFEGADEPLELEVSADPRYILLLDGEVVGRGPDNGDVKHWFARRMTLTPGRGRHLLEAVVWKHDVAYENGRTVDRAEEDRPFCHLTWRTGFALKAEGVYDARLTTGTAPWRMAVLGRTRPIGRGAGGWAFGAGPQYEVDGISVLDERPDDSAFVPAVVQIAKGSSDPARVALGGVTPRGRRTFRSLLPEQMARTVRPGETPRAFTVPAHASVTNVFDLGDYYCAYPLLRVSGGRGARISWGWTEALRSPDLLARDVDFGKTNRAMRAGMVFSDRYALVDVFRPDGRQDARFTVPWWRCGRWCRLVVETGDEPVTVGDVAIEETRYPAEEEGLFEAEGDESLAAIRRMSVRGLQNCMHEIMFDCPFWEQQMYGGDIRVSFLGVTAMTRDDRLIRQCLGIFDNARGADGYIPMNWPSVNDQHSTTWLLSWIIAVGDYAMWHGDRAWLKDRLAGVEHSLHGVARYENRRGLLENAWGWNYLDWVADWKDDGCAPPGASYGKGESAALNLLYLMAVQKAAVALEACGETSRAAYWRTRAERLSKTVAETFADAGRGILADTPTKTSFSEHVQALAVLTDCVTGDAAVRALAAIEGEKGLSPCSSFFLSYVFEACRKLDRGDLVLRKLDTWREYVKLDLKCPLESVFFPRSDCHGFGAHPLFHFHSLLAGVTPAAPFFEKVRVAPSPGGLRAIRAKTPHPKGFVETNLSFDGKGGVSGRVKLPEGVTGSFAWAGKSAALKSGETVVAMTAE